MPGDIYLHLLDILASRVVNDSLPVRQIREDRKAKETRPGDRHLASLISLVQS